MKNQEIADIFYNMADILEILNVNWKPQAYRKAARSIESMNENIETIYEKKGLKGIDEIPGVGKSIAKKTEEYLKTGKIKEYENLKKKIPKGLDELMDVMGLGPKKVKKLFEELKIKNIKELKTALKKHKIESLEGFGKKSEENIEKSLELIKQRKKRLLLGEVYPIVKELIEYLKEKKETKKVEVAGSFRRMEETIGDIDILAVSNNGKKTIQDFIKFPEVKRVLAKGNTKGVVLLKNNLQCDLRVVKENQFGSALQYFTGNKPHNIELRKIAIKKGYKLNEYGLFKNKKRVAGNTEKEIYKKLGFQYIPPEIRINEDELKKKIPRLIDYNDIKGDLHVHTRDSDGLNTIMEMALAAKKLNYNYLGITNHSKTRKISSGLEEKDLIKKIKEIKNTKVKGLKLLSGSEVDILKNGELDYSDKILKKLDIVIAAIHSGFKTDKKKMVDRILKALENENVKIFAHPFGRLINKREPYNLDFEKICKFCAKNEKYIEINAQPERLDLDYKNIKIALKHNVKFIINTDAHKKENLEFMRFGVAQAMKAWCRKKDIINTLPLKEFMKKMK